jgi:hypothetical protein
MYAGRREREASPVERTGAFSAKRFHLGATRKMSLSLLDRLGVQYLADSALRPNRSEFISRIG